jgi:threonyl-tRNA synthetase
MEQRDWGSWLAGLDWKPISEDEYKALPEDERLRRIRHSTSHVMASAIARLHPGTEFATGPATEQGFFYDTRPADGAATLTNEDIEPVQKVMDEISSGDHPFETTVVPKSDAIEYFRHTGQNCKLEIMERIEDEVVSLYRHAEFVDLCAGPHVPNTKYCRHAKLLNLSGAHWRGEDHPSLTRVSGTAWPDRKALQKHLRFLEEVKKRDHRVLGPQLDLFSFHPWAAAAMWHPKGLIVRNELMKLWRDSTAPHDYVEILNPLLYRKELFVTSGHWEHFREDMYIFNDDQGEPYLMLKPMNCPDTMLYFRSQVRSYRDLPMRVSEGQILHRNEVTGALHGLMRTRSFVQDDAHIFLTAEQVEEEVRILMGMLEQVYTAFGLDYSICLSTRPEEFMGEVETWNEAEAALKQTLDAAGVEYTINEGDGAFYGPKIDVNIRDSLGRQWQCGTIQLDFQLPQRFELKFAAADGSLQTPIVIHRAIVGSFERFAGVVLEHLNGALPTWVAPVQVAVLPVSDPFLDYANEVVARLKAEDIRVELEHDQSINYRIRSAEKRKVPYMLVLGEREAEAGTATVRRHKIKEQRVLSVDELVDELKAKIRTREFDVKLTPIAAPIDTSLGGSTEDEAY